MKTYTFTWEPCKGEAHTNPHIDHCPLCAPFWGHNPVSVQNAGKMAYIVHAKHGGFSMAFAGKSAAEACVLAWVESGDLSAQWTRAKLKHPRRFT